MTTITTGSKEFFKGIGQIKFEGAKSDNPLAYRWYDENKIIAGKSMKDHLKFACAYWHSFVATGGLSDFAPSNLICPIPLKNSLLPVVIVVIFKI